MVRLFPFGKDDFDRLIEWIDSPALLLQWAGPIFQFPLNHEQLNQYISADTSNRRIFKVVNAQDEVVGHIELDNINTYHLSATISRVLVNPSYQGQGIGTLMVKGILSFGFDELKLHRIELRVFDFNTSALACYKKVGFQIEGHFRDYRRFENEYWSLYQMSILKQEWEKLNGMNERKKV